MAPNTVGSAGLKLPNGDKVTVDDLARMYREQVKTPIPSSAFLSDDGPAGSMKLKIVWTSRDCYQLESSNLAQFYVVKVNGQVVSAVEAVADPMDVSNM